jgi:hypothetical protein
MNRLAIDNVNELSDASKKSRNYIPTTMIDMRENFLINRGYIIK